MHPHPLPTLKAYNYSVLRFFLEEKGRKNDVLAVLDLLEDFSARHYRLIHLGKAKRDFIKHHIPLKGKNVLELGTYIGSTAAFLAFSGAKVTTIEHAQPTWAFANWVFNFLGVKEQIISKKMKVLDFLEENTQKFDVILVDHNKEETKQVIHMLEEKNQLKTNTFVIIDNLENKTMNGIIEFMNKRFIQKKIYDNSLGIWAKETTKAIK